MENIMNLQDAETGEQFEVRLSPTSAFRAQNDMLFATSLLNAARQARIETNACLASEPAQNTSLDKASRCMDMLEEELEEQEIYENKENFRWSHEAIMLLVDEYRLRESSMSSGKISHKKAWDEMSTIMNAKGHTFSGRQCMTKVNTMKRTYKTIKDHNSKSGNNNRTWKYYEVMKSLLGKKAYMDPLSTISSTGSVTYKSEKLKSANSCSNDSSSESSGPVSRKRRVSNTLEAILANRQTAEDQKNKRHKDRMEMSQKILDKLDSIWNKL